MRCVYSLKRVKDKGGEDIRVQQEVNWLFMFFSLLMNYSLSWDGFSAVARNQAISPNLWKEPCDLSIELFCFELLRFAPFSKQYINLTSRKQGFSTTNKPCLIYLQIQFSKQNRAGPKFQRHFPEILWKRGKLSERKGGRSDSVLSSTMTIYS
jgi:hypothetical protein